jgi:hypothetical protein
MHIHLHAHSFLQIKLAKFNLLKSESGNYATRDMGQIDPGKVTPNNHMHQRVIDDDSTEEKVHLANTDTVQPHVQQRNLGDGSTHVNYSVSEMTECHLDEKCLHSEHVIEFCEGARCR